MSEKAIALSFASKEKQAPLVVSAAARLSTKLIESLHDGWDEGVELYNINVPMIADLEDHSIVYTKASPSFWNSGSLYQEETDCGNKTGDPDLAQPSKLSHNDSRTVTVSRTRLFKWAPQLQDIARCVNDSPPDTDAWAISKGFTRSGDASFHSKTQSSSQKFLVSPL